MKSSAIDTVTPRSCGGASTPHHAAAMTVRSASVAMAPPWTMSPRVTLEGCHGSRSLTSSSPSSSAGLVLDAQLDDERRLGEELRDDVAAALRFGCHASKFSHRPARAKDFSGEVSRAGIIWHPWRERVS